MGVFYAMIDGKNERELALLPTRLNRVFKILQGAPLPLHTSKRRRSGSPEPESHGEVHNRKVAFHSGRRRLADRGRRPHLAVAQWREVRRGRDAGGHPICWYRGVSVDTATFGGGACE